MAAATSSAAALVCFSATPAAISVATAVLLPSPAPVFTSSSSATVIASSPALSTAADRWVGKTPSRRLVRDGGDKGAGRGEDLGHALCTRVAPGRPEQHPPTVPDRPDGEHEVRRRPLGRVPGPGPAHDRLPHRLGGLLGERLKDGRAARNVPEESAPDDARGPCELFEGDVLVPAELPAGRGRDACPVGPRVAAQRLAGGGLGHDQPRCDGARDSAAVSARRDGPPPAGARCRGRAVLTVCQPVPSGVGTRPGSCSSPATGRNGEMNTLYIAAPRTPPTSGPTMGTQK
jgi:hypothetical protein